MQFPLDFDLNEHRDMVVEGARAVQKAEERRTHELKFAVEDFQGAAAGSREEVGSAMELISTAISADQRAERATMKALAPMLILGLEAADAPDEVIEAARRRFGLELPPGQDADVCQPEASGEATIPGIDPDLVAEPERELRFEEEDENHGD